MYFSGEMFIYVRINTYPGFALETRYLQMTSGGSYLVSLPKDWVRENGLEKGSQLGILRLDLRTLLIDSSPLGRPVATGVDLNMGDDVGRELTASYLSGYDRILIKSKGMITPAQKEVIRTWASRLAGLEVINETSNSMLLMNMIVPMDLSVADVMRRMHQIGSSMLVDGIRSLVEDNPSLARNVVERDDALDRLYFLVIRQLKSAVKDPILAETMGVSPVQCLDLRFAAGMMEKIGDKSVDLCADFHPGGERLPSQCLGFGNRLEVLYEQATRALLDGNFSLSGMVTKKRSEVADSLSVMAENTPRREEAIGILEDVAGHIFDIADVVTEGS